ncbi:SpoIIE family protein phosphatase [Pseudonocardia sp.]|uniref:SpoIIE family protein phosphatase n=1 Tax=Pseudonocardia sp. TaxID=60912 RepID=UPI002605C1CF|nr:SpoIIE family protein phosphatase [Pseudonocardia sp.]MCW2717211.1 multi-sensor signal transduction histidine kinase [Pseudonocardia sp.]
MSERASESLFAGGGEMGRVMADHDWAATPLGPPDTWPQGLRSVVRILLTSQFAMWMGWGDELAVLYNDAYRRDTLRAKHPWALGRPAHEVWAEIWPDIGPRIRTVMDTGIATWDEGLQLFLERSGYPEETYHTFSYSPLDDGSGHVTGMLCVVSEDTERVLGERRLRTLSELGDISAVTAPTVEAACEAALAALERGRADVPFAAIHLAESDGTGSVLLRTAHYGVADDSSVVPERLDRATDPGSPAWNVLDTGRTRTLTGLAAAHPGLYAPTAPPPRDDLPDSLVVVPLPGGAAGGRAGVLFAGLSPFRAPDTEYRRFLDLIAGQISTAIADARAFEVQRRRNEDLAALDRAKTEFFTGVSHELRTPLTLIAGPAEDGLADTDEPLPPGQRTRMEIIHRNSGRLRRLVDVMLDFARLERAADASDRVAVDLPGLTRDLAESFAPAVHRAGLELSIDCPPLPSAVSVDVDMWEKIVLNLLSNALKYTLAGHIRLSLHREADGVRLAVADSGIGIPAADLPLLFQRFHRVRGAEGRSHEGSGIGLALVAELAALHGGTAGVESEHGTGSTFTVTLPPSLLTGEAPAPYRTSTSAQLYREEALQWSGPVEDRLPLSPVDAGPAAGATVLVVEDNADLRAFLARLLEPHYTVRLAADGRAALDRIAESVPDLVLTDVMMPGVDGFALLTAMRADPATATTPVVVLSARAGEEAAIEGLGAGADDYVVKPFSSHDLLARVRSNIALSRLRNHETSWRRALVAALQDGFYVIDDDDAVIEVNDAFGAILGYGPEGLPYRMPYPWVPSSEVDPEAAALAAQAPAGRYSTRFVTPLAHRDGRRVWVEAVHNVATDPSTGRSVRVGTLRDVTEARRAEQANELLAEIGRLQGDAGTLADRLRAILRAAAPVLADAAVLGLRRPDDSFTPFAAGDPHRPEVEEQLLGLPPQRATADDLARLAEGEPYVVDAPPDAPLATRTALLSPLMADGRMLGTLAFLSATGSHRFDAADRALAAEISRRVSRLVDTELARAQDRQVHRIVAELGTAATVDEAAHVLVHGIADLLGAEAVGALIQRPGRGLELVHQVGFSPSIVARYEFSRADETHPLADCARTGTAVWLHDIDDWAAAYPHLIAEHDGIAFAGYAALPLVVGTRVVGVLSIAFATSRSFEENERELAGSLASRAALAFERLTLAAMRDEVADTLQRSLLPSALPVLSRLDLAARYLPAAWGSKAGGDWYDVLELDDDRVAVVVGDVVGQGPSAAAVMGQLRSALAAHLLHEQPPATALRLLDRFAQRIDGARGSSVVCLVIDTRTGVLRWARAGHPPPLVLDEAGARYLDDAEGCVLGVPGAPPFTEGGAVLRPGASVLLYTDGLVERRTEIIDDGLDRLAAAAGAHASDPTPMLIPAVLRDVVDGAGPADDIAVLVARLRPGALVEDLPALATGLPGMRRAVRAWSVASGLGDEQLDDLQFALGEAVSNAVEHAYRDEAPGTVRYRLERTASGDVKGEIVDTGTWRPVPADPGHRGRGLEMIRALTEDVVVETHDGGTTVRFTVPGRTEPAPAGAGDTAPTPARREEPPATCELRIHREPGGDLRIELTGALDLATVTPIAAQVDDTVRTALAGVVLDLRGVTFLGSAGAGLVLGAAHAAGGRLRLLTDPDGAPHRILALTGIGGHVPIGPAPELAG